MKKVLFYTIPATLLLTLGIGYYAYAWICDASATAYNTSNHTYANGTAYTSGLNDNFAKADIKYENNNGQWGSLIPVAKSGPTQGAAQAFKSSFFAKGTKVKVYTEASGVHDNGDPELDNPTASVNL